MTFNLPAAVLLGLVLLCTAILYGCLRAFERLQARLDGQSGGQRWATIGVAGGVCVVALCTFWACFAFSAGFWQALGLNLP
jgi:hypothetical protein